MKKLLYFTSFLAFSNFLDSSSGYIGFNIGGGFSNNNLSLSKNAPDSAINTTFQGSGVLADIKGGYGYLLDDLYLGIEGVWGISNIEGEHKSGIPNAPNSEQKIKFKMRDTFSLNGHVGGKFENLLSYLIVGFSYSYWRSEASVNAAPALVGLPTSSKKTGYLPGFNLGIGMRGKVAEKLSIGLEYMHTWFKKRSLTVTDIYNVAQPGVNLDTTNKYGTHKIVIGLIYHL